MITLHWMSIVLYCLVSFWSGFLLTAILSMARDERRFPKEKNDG